MVLQIIFKDFSSYIPIWKIRSTPPIVSAFVLDELKTYVRNFEQ